MSTIGSTGANIIARKICALTKFKDSEQVRILKRKYDQLEKDLKNLESAYKKTINVALTAMSRCDYCENIIHNDEYNDLDICDNCDARDMCETWCRYDDLVDDKYIIDCEVCPRKICIDCSEQCQVCNYLVCDECMFETDLCKLCNYN